MLWLFLKCLFPFLLCATLFSASLALLPLVSFFLFPGMHSADLPGRLFSNYAASSHLLQGPFILVLLSFLLPVSCLLLKVWTLCHRFFFFLACLLLYFYLQL